MKKIISAASAAILCLGLWIMAFAPVLTSCSSDDDNNSPDPAPKEKAAVFIGRMGSYDYWLQIAWSFMKECNDRKITGLYADTEDDNDYQSQLDAIAELDTLNYDIIGVAIAPFWSESNHKVEEAMAAYWNKHKVPIIIVDTPVDEQVSPLKDIYLCYVGSDNNEAGIMLAKEMKKNGATLENTLVVRKAASTPTVARLDGMGTEFGGKMNCAEVTMEDVEEKVLAMLDGKKNVAFLNGSLVLASDELFEKLSESGVNIYTFDYDMFFEDYIEDGTIKGVLAQNTFAMGEKAVDLMLPSSVPVGRKMFVEPVYICKENMDSESVRQFVDF